MPPPGSGVAVQGSGVGWKPLRKLRARQGPRASRSWSVHPSPQGRGLDSGTAWDDLKPPAASPEDQIQDDQRQDETDPTAAIVSKPRAHVVPTTTKQQEKDNENQEEWHRRENSTGTASPRAVSRLAVALCDKATRSPGFLAAFAGETLTFGPLEHGAPCSNLGGMTTDLNTNSEVLTAHFTEKKAATLAASELLGLGFTTAELHLFFGQETLTDGSEAQTSARSGWQRVLDHLQAPSTQPDLPVAFDAAKTAGPCPEGSVATLILTVHASAQVRAILNQHGAELT